MTFRDWLEDTKQEVRRDGLAGARRQAYRFYVGMWRRVGRWTPDRGHPVYESEWDALVVLDACRADLMREVRDQFDFIEVVSERRSLGSSSPEWLEKNFTGEYREEMARTLHVSANIFTQEKLDPNDWLHLDEVWRDGWDKELGTVRPETVTDRAIHHHRKLGPERMIVHYMQPHYPFIAHPISDGWTPETSDGRAGVWDRLRNGDVTKEEVWSRYRQNLIDVLVEVQSLVENIDAKRVVITADHGNFVGEWGLYGHPIHVPLAAVRTVPWAVTTAKDRQTREPEPQRGTSDVGLQEKLEDLGYR